MSMVRKLLNVKLYIVTTKAYYIALPRSNFIKTVLSYESTRYI